MITRETEHIYTDDLKKKRQVRAPWPFITDKQYSWGVFEDIRPLNTTKNKTLKPL